MQRDEVLRMYLYNYWANAKLPAEASNLRSDQFVAPSPYSHGSVRATLVHILSAEWVWRVRCASGESPSALLDEKDFPSVEALKERWSEEQKLMLSYLNSLDESELNRVVKYRRVGGQPSETVLWHILMHVILHGVEHRSQAAALLTQFGHSPGDIDFVHFLRAWGR